MANKIKKSVVFLGYSCNNNCIFCINSDKRKLPNRKTLEIKKEIQGARDRGATYLELIGGEVTIRKDAMEIISFGRDLGFNTISITTNGRMLSYKEYAEKFLQSGVTDLVFSIHGHKKEIHDSLTKTKGSFEQLLQGLNNVKDLGFKKLGSNTTIVKQNYKFLPQVGEFIYKQGIKNSEFIFVDPNYGGAFNHFKDLVPRISEISPWVKKCLDIGKKNNIPHWHIRYVPLCYFSDYLNQISELDEVKTFETEHLASDFRNYKVEESRLEAGRAKGKQCQECKLNNICEGIWKEYAKNYGLEELKAIK